MEQNQEINEEGQCENMLVGKGRDECRTVRTANGLCVTLITNLAVL